MDKLICCVTKLLNALVIRDGNRVKVLGVTTLKRLSSMPYIPTLDEQGLKGFDVKVWHGMYAPKGTPQQSIEKLNAALRIALEEEIVKQRLTDLNAEIVSMEKATPQGLCSHLKAETVRWGALIRAANIPTN